MCEVGSHTKLVQIIKNMPQRKEKFLTGGIYHITSKIIDDNLLFKNENDYFRGIYSIYELNNANPVNIFNRRRARITEKKFEKLCEVGSRTKLLNDKRDKFVEILAFCFMSNHIHLLLKQIKDNGISKFMQKVGGGYGRYFNDKYKRKGHVFQDTFKSVYIENDNQLTTVFAYIHANPLSIIEPGYKEKGIKNPETAISFLQEEYRWSSYFDYLGKKNFPSITDRDFLLETLGGSQGCKDLIKNWILYKKYLNDSNNLFLK